MSGVFINYRGDDSETAAVLIDKKLTPLFGPDCVFLDSRSIPVGADYIEELLGRLRTCSVLVVVIGPRWLALTNAKGERRIDGTEDWIRREIHEALVGGLRVIPVLLDGTQLPAETELPEDIRDLSRRQYVPLRRRYTSVDLAFLAERILAAEPELARMALRRQAGTGSIPHQLPATVAHFAGRVNELTRLTELLNHRTAPDGTVAISAVSGMAGIGKSALAIHWAHQIIDRFSDGQLYVNLRAFGPSDSVMTPAEAIRQFLDALQVPAERIPVELDAQAALYRSELADRRILIVLDNARDTGQVRPLLPGTSSCLVLVTSRNQLTGLIAGDGAYPLTLGLLTDEEARQLLTLRLGAARVTSEPVAVAEIITRCAHLPLALALASARAALQPHHALQSLAEDLRDSQHRWDALADHEHVMDVRTVFSWSYQALTPATARLFRLLALHPVPDVSVTAAASLVAMPTSMTRTLLSELTRASMLVEHSPGRYNLHDLLRAYATDLTHAIDSDENRHAAIRRMLDHYLNFAHAATMLVDPAQDPLVLVSARPSEPPVHFIEHQQAMDWLTTERSALLAAIEYAVISGHHTHAWQLAWALRAYLDRRGHWHDLADTGRAAVAAAQQLAEPTTQARAHRTLAHAYTRLGRFYDAYTNLTRALSWYRLAGDQAGQAHTYHSLGYLWGQRGQHEQALRNSRQALNLYRAVNHKNGEARALNAVGWYLARLGDYHQALVYCRQALILHRNLDNPHGEANTWDSIGYVQHYLGQHTEAIVSYQHALAVYRNLSSRYEEATTLIHIGESYHALHDPNATRDAWKLALEIFNDLNHPKADRLRVKLTAIDTSL